MTSTSSGGKNSMGPEATAVMTVDQTSPKDILGIKKTPTRFVPPALQIWTAGVMATGRSKYGELYDVYGYDGMNWRMKAVRLSVYLEAIDRHYQATKDGQWF